MADGARRTADGRGAGAGAVEPLAWGEALARALLEHSADIILVLSVDHRCRFASPALFRVLGYRPEAVVGRDVVPLHHPDDLKRVGAMLAEAAANPGRPAEAEVRLRHADGSWRWMAVVAVNLLHDPAVGGIVCTLHDVTAQHEAARAAVDALQEQQAANQDLLRVNQAKSELLALVSHEFRTPLTVITGYADLLQWAPADEATTLEYARTIGAEAARLNRLIDDLLLLARAEAAQLVLHRAPIDLNLLVAEEVERLRQTAPDRQIAVRLERGLPPVDADPDRIAQVVGNLVNNAIKYSPDGGEVAVSTRREGESALFVVADEGIGIPAELLPTIFERFKRVEAGVASTIQGTGLGLSIVRQIARLHGGEVWAESEEGKGSTFFVRLPLAAPDGGNGREPAAGEPALAGRLG